MFDFARQRNG